MTRPELRGEVSRLLLDGRGGTVQRRPDEVDRQVEHLRSPRLPDVPHVGQSTVDPGDGRHRRGGRPNHSGIQILEVRPRSRTCSLRSGDERGMTGAPRGQATILLHQSRCAAR